ncbi:MAG TPA: DUF5011 domain-containing protein [Gammaproteobacteria bacterium]|nr:DUF5011 domain-containing protein [Gammaproteobacteria bacterium]
MHDTTHPKNHLKKNAVASALAIAIGTSTASFNSTADIYVWSASNSGDVVFTLLDAAGFVTKNSSITGRGANQAQTPLSGTLTYNTVSNTGTATFTPFGFFNKGDAVASGITLEKIPAGVNAGNNNLVMTNMLFDWNGNNGIPVSIVWDAEGLFNEMDGTPVSFTLNADGSINSASTFSDGALPASDDTFEPSIPGSYLGLGPSPLASTDFNTNNIASCSTGVDADFTNNNGGGCMTVNPSADVTQGVATDNDINQAQAPFNASLIGTGPGIGGNPMQDGPFQGFGANFDFVNITLTSFTDTTPPVLTMNAHGAPAGTTPLTLTVGVDTYSEPGATCTDAAPLNTDLNGSVVIGGDAVVDVIGIYNVTYNCQDASNNAAGTETRVVNVVAPGVPAISLLGATPVTHECATTYTDAGASASDPEDGDISASVIATPNNGVDLTKGTINETTLGGQTIDYDVQDSGANAAPTVTRTVTVEDTTNPVVTLIGANTDEIVSTTTENPVAAYNDPLASATDSCDPTFPQGAIGFTGGSVDLTVPDTGVEKLSYDISYTVTDASGNSDTAIRTVNVTRSQPVISLSDGAGGVGNAGLVLDINEAYVEQGIDIIDAQDGNVPGVTASGTTSGISYTIDSSAVDISTAGSYVVTYNATDSDGNKATQVIRTVTVGAKGAGSNFTMLEASGQVFGGTNDVLFDWDGVTFNTDETDTNFGVMKISSVKPQQFFQFFWTSHHIRVFGPGSYSFDTTCTSAQYDAGITDCGGSNPITMTVGAGQVGGHILFDWGQDNNGTPCGVANCDIDVVNVWDVDKAWDRHGAAETSKVNKLFDGPAGTPPEPTTLWGLVSTDINGDNINGSPMVDGPFQGFYANFNSTPATKGKERVPVVITQPNTDLGGGALASLNILGLFASLMMLLGLRTISRKK